MKTCTCLTIRKKKIERKRNEQERGKERMDGPWGIVDGLPRSCNSNLECREIAKELFNNSEFKSKDITQALRALSSPLELPRGTVVECIKNECRCGSIFWKDGITCLEPTTFTYISAGLIAIPTLLALFGFIYGIKPLLILAWHRKIQFHASEITCILASAALFTIFWFQVDILIMHFEKKRFRYESFVVGIVMAGLLTISSVFRLALTWINLASKADRLHNFGRELMLTKYGIYLLAGVWATIVLGAAIFKNVMIGSAITIVFSLLLGISLLRGANELFFLFQENKPRGLQGCIFFARALFSYRPYNEFGELSLSSGFQSTTQDTKPDTFFNGKNIEVGDDNNNNNNYDDDDDEEDEDDDDDYDKDDYDYDIEQEKEKQKNNKKVSIELKEIQNQARLKAQFSNENDETRNAEKRSFAKFATRVLITAQRINMAIIVFAVSAALFLIFFFDTEYDGESPFKQIWRWAILGCSISLCIGVIMCIWFFRSSYETRLRLLYAGRRLAKERELERRETGRDSISERPDQFGGTGAGISPMASVPSFSSVFSTESQFELYQSNKTKTGP